MYLSGTMREMCIKVALGGDCGQLNPTEASLLLVFHLLHLLIKVPFSIPAAPVVSSRHRPLAAHQVGASDESIGVALSTDNMATLAKKLRSRTLAGKLGGSMRRLRLECIPRLYSLAHVSSVVDNGPVLDFPKYSTLITSL